jgi:diamine N-acetyltransferase
MPDVAWPRLGYDGGQLAGFMMAAFAVGHENPLFHSCLWRFAIGAGHQGRGDGRFAVGGLCHEARRRGHRRRTVCYHAGGHGPEEFYRRVGFHPGECHAGETAAERVLLASGGGRAAEEAQDSSGAVSGRQCAR